MSTSISSRSQKFNQLTGKDKTARITHPEMFALLAIGGEETLKELMGARADNENMKQGMYRKIAQEGTVNMNDIDDDNTEKQTLNVIDVYMIGLGLKTDLITPGLVLQSVSLQEDSLSDIRELAKARILLEDADSSEFVENDEEEIEDPTTLDYEFFLNEGFEQE